MTRFDILPANLAQTRTQSLANGLLGSKSLGQVIRRLPQHFVGFQFPGAKYALTKSRTVALHSTANPGDIHKVSTDADNHGFAPEAKPRR